RENLFTLLGGSYRLHVEETVTRLCPTNLCDGERTVGGGGLRSLLGDAARTWRAVVSPHTAAADPANDVGVLEDPEQNTVDHEGAPDREDTQFAMSDPGLDEPPTFLRSFLDEIDSDGRTLHFAHVLFPHVPWRFLPGGQTYAPIPISRYWGPKLHDQEWPFTVDRHRQVMQTIYTDSLLGATLQQLRETGVYDRALVVVTADHGLNFLPGSAQPWKNLTEENPAQLMWVPLLVKAPGQDAGSVDDRNVMLIDVLPTIADILNVDIPWKVDGTSALGNPRKDPTKLFWSKENQKSPSTVDGLAWLLIIKRGFTDHFLEPDGGEQGLYRVGELGHLVGTSPSAYPTGIAHTAARIDQADQFNDVDRKRDIPALVTGSLDGRPPAGVEGIVIALNGTIAGTSAIFPLGEEEHAFATLVAPSLLKSGSNRVELFVVERSDGELRLSPSRVPL
ncbi:MAG TPA: sulfatase-like hydrolase/transferase, partial [Acidimicrobiia bacterium]|nr:sulfatase-like hydrolase/transferase [Acidimicrobiia bacterium]